MILALGLICIGVLLLYGGAEFLVKGSVGLSRRFGVSPLVIGLVVVAYGTSMPELVVGLEAAWKGAADIAVSNVVGSNICTIGVVLGLAVLIKPANVAGHLVTRHGPLMIGSTVLLALVLMDGSVGRLEGGLLVGGIIGYTWFSLRAGRRSASRDDFGQEIPADSQFGSWFPDGMRLGAGLVGLCVGGNILINGATDLAARMNVPEALIGLTLVAIGTSAPDLVASIVAAVRGQTDLAIGNAIGSVLFNSTNALGAAALLRPLEGFELARLDLLVMVAIAALSLPLMLSGRLLQRWEGVLLVSCYGFYVAARWDNL